MHVLKSIRVENAIICHQAKQNNLFKKFLEICKEKNINIIYVRSGDEVKIKNINFKIIHPQNELISNNPLNNNAIVCKLIYNNFSMLFTGDIEKEAEDLIIKQGIDLKSTLLKVGHHGSKTSSGEKFISAVKPKIALIGVEKNNKFGHPNTEVIERLKRANTQIYRTDLCGEISISITAKRFNPNKATSK